MNIAISRLYFASRIAGTHFALSLLVAILLAMLVFWIWYPHPYRDMMGSFRLFWLIVGIDVVCGPLLTFILASPRKSRRELWLDLALVATIQLSAFAYGIYRAYDARPVVLVYEVDRLRVLTQGEIYQSELKDPQVIIHKLPHFGILKLATKEKTSKNVSPHDVTLALQGYDLGQRPSWWIPYAEAEQAIRMQARPLSELAQRLNEQKRKMLEDAIRTSQLPVSAYRYLPLTSADQWEWTAILDGDMQIIAAVPVDGFQ